MSAYVDWIAWTHENQPGLWSGYTYWGPLNEDVLAQFDTLDIPFLQPVDPSVFGSLDGTNFLFYWLWFFGEQSEGEKAMKILDDLVN